jgi:maltose O-acetyltransferase
MLVRTEKERMLAGERYNNYLCIILDNNEVRIGNHVMIGPAVQIYTAAHDLQAGTRNQGWETTKPELLRASSHNS